MQETMTAIAYYEMCCLRGNDMCRRFCFHYMLKQSWEERNVRCDWSVLSVGPPVPAQMHSRGHVPETRPCAAELLLLCHFLQLMCRATSGQEQSGHFLRLFLAEHMFPAVLSILEACCGYCTGAIWLRRAVSWGFPATGGAFSAV